MRLSAPFSAIGAVLAYLVSGPITDRLGKKFTLSVGSIFVIAATVVMLLLQVLLMLLRRKRQEV